MNQTKLMNQVSRILSTSSYMNRLQGGDDDDLDMDTFYGGTSAINALDNIFQGGGFTNGGFGGGVQRQVINPTSEDMEPDMDMDEPIHEPVLDQLDEDHEISSTNYNSDSDTMSTSNSDIDVSVDDEYDRVRELILKNENGVSIIQTDSLISSMAGGKAIKPSIAISSKFPYVVKSNFTVKSKPNL